MDEELQKTHDREWNRFLTEYQKRKTGFYSLVKWIDLWESYERNTKDYYIQLWKEHKK